MAVHFPDKARGIAVYCGLESEDDFMTEKTRTEFLEIGEVAVRLDQHPDDIGTAPQHEPFTDTDRNVLTEKCLSCDALYFVAYSRTYGTGRTFADLTDQLQLRLEEDHSSGRKHRSVIPLRWFESTRKRSREQKP